MKQTLGKVALLAITMASSILLNACGSDSGQRLQQFGTQADDGARSIAVDRMENVFVAGFTISAPSELPSAGKIDLSVRKYNANGKELWTRRFDASDLGLASLISPVAVDGSGNVFAVGSTLKTFPGQRGPDGAAALMRRYDTNGNELWTRQFGPNEEAVAITVNGMGSVWVAGNTFGTFPGQRRAENLDAFVRQYSANGKELWTRWFGTNGDDSASAITVDGLGNI